jgi:hypothetical protein
VQGAKGTERLSERAGIPGPAPDALQKKLQSPLSAVA